MRTHISQIVLGVISSQLDKQNDKGFEKYKESLDDVEFEEYDWNVMVIEELIDGMQYMVKENLRLKTKLEEYENQHGKGNSDVNFKVYQKDVLRTMPKLEEGYNNFRMLLSNFALGVNGEAGEFTEVVKKNVHDSHSFNREKFVEEGGDLLFYLTGLCQLYGVTLEEVATYNMFKRMKRYPHGYSGKASIARVDIGSKVDEKA